MRLRDVKKLACKLKEREPGQIQKGKGKYITWGKKKIKKNLLTTLDKYD